MNEYRLPPPEARGENLCGPNVKEFTVGSWCAEPNGQGPVTAVAVSIRLENGVDIVLRLKSPKRVDQFIQMLLRHKRDVWPEAP